MLSAALCRGLTWPICRGQTRLSLAGQPLEFGLVETRDTPFAPESKADRSQVLLEIDAFSCNYRDQAMLLRLAEARSQGGFGYFGSDFVGRVVARGAAVTRWQVGDRVMGDGSYPQGGGLPTNYASQRLLPIPDDKLVAVPGEMSDEVAAVFTIGAQTSYAMLRRLALWPGCRVLVTAARSNTSMFVLNALQRRDVECWALTTSVREGWPAHVRVIVHPAGRPLAENEELRAVGGFDRVIDPYFDVYLGQVLPFLKLAGRYITCGFYQQFAGLEPVTPLQPNLLAVAIMRNLEIMGNCLGSTQDLLEAVEDYRQGLLQVTLDRTFSGEEVGPFVERTFCDRSRFGKVVYRYDA